MNLCISVVLEKSSDVEKSSAETLWIVQIFLYYCV